MADRRMFAKTIIDSDAFLDMPLSSQALYFHLSMRADDEGFINNPKKIQRMIGASEDDLKVLIAKSFIIPFESGIVVIKHWKIHNYIRGDRLKNTVYEEEKNLLEVKDNGAYTLNTELKEIEKLDSNDKRKIAYHNSSLPYSFEYKIKRAFDGMECPVCNKIMRSSYKLSMPTIQHNLPISKGGQHEIDNISVICESCNTSIKDNETDSLNNAKVIEVWDKICIAEKEKIKWFDNPQILENIDVSQVTDKCQSSDSIGKVRLGKDSIGKDRLGKVNKEPKEKPLDSMKTMVDNTELSDSLKNTIKDWLDYKKEIKKPYKSERGFQQFINMVAKYSLTYSDDEIINVINKSMASGYQGVVWDWLEKGKKTNSYVDAINNRMNVVDDWLNEMQNGGE